MGQYLYDQLKNMVGRVYIDSSDKYSILDKLPNTLKESVKDMVIDNRSTLVNVDFNSDRFNMNMLFKTPVKLHVKGNKNYIETFTYKTLTIVKDGEVQNIPQLKDINGDIVKLSFIDIVNWDSIKNQIYTLDNFIETKITIKMLQYRQKALNSFIKKDENISSILNSDGSLKLNYTKSRESDDSILPLFDIKLKAVESIPSLKSIETKLMDNKKLTKREIIFKTFIDNYRYYNQEDLKNQKKELQNLLKNLRNLYMLGRAYREINRDGFNIGSEMETVYNLKLNRSNIEIDLIVEEVRSVVGRDIDVGIDI